MKDAKWWKVKRTTAGDASEGYVPASYVKILKDARNSDDDTPDAVSDAGRPDDAASDTSWSKVDKEDGALVNDPSWSALGAE